MRSFKRGQAIKVAIVERMTEGSALTRQPGTRKYFLDVRVRRRVSETAPVSQRGHVDGFSKDRTEIALIAKADFLAELGDRLVRGSQQGLRFSDAEMVQVGKERLPGNLLKDPHEVRLADVQQLSRVFDADTLIVVGFQEFKERKKSSQGLLFGLVRVLAGKMRGVVVDEQDQGHFDVGAHGQAGQASRDGKGSVNPPDQAEDIGRDSGSSAHDKREANLLKIEGHQKRRLFAVSSCFTDCVRHEEKGRDFGIGASVSPHPVMKRGANDDQFPLLAFEGAFRNLAKDLPTHNIRNLEIIVAIHPHGLAVTKNLEGHGDRKRGVEGPNMHTIGADLGGYRS